jgi:transcription antitermination factor NusG
MRKAVAARAEPQAAEFGGSKWGRLKGHPVARTRTPTTNRHLLVAIPPACGNLLPELGFGFENDLGATLFLRTAPYREQHGTNGPSEPRPAIGNSREPWPGERWFAVQCKANREHGAAIQLRNQRFLVFLPLREKTWRHARRIEVRRVPFFLGYLFVALDLDRDQWRSVNGTCGVQRLVTAGGDARPVPLPQGVVEAWRSETDDRDCLRHEEPLRVGQAVRIQSGPFGDQLGELVEFDDAGRVRVLIELLGGRVPVTMPRGKVMAAR